MVQIFGFEIDIFSFAPAIFATLLSIYNWYKMTRPANIFPNEIINYGFIASEYHDGNQLCIPIILHNEAANKGLVTSVKVGFERGGEVKYLEILGRARLAEININLAYNMDWDKFEAEGYSIIQPTYPIVVEGYQSTDVVFIAQTTSEDNVIPPGEQLNCIIEVKFGRGKINSVKFPFMLSQEAAEVDNQLQWLEP